MIHWPTHYWSISYLSKFHHHVSKDVEEAHNSIPQPAVGQRLLVTSTGTLTDTDTQSRKSHHVGRLFKITRHSDTPQENH